MTFLLFLQYQMRLVFTLNIKPLPTGIIKLTLCMLFCLLLNFFKIFLSGIPGANPESLFQRGSNFFLLVNEWIKIQLKSDSHYQNYLIRDRISQKCHFVTKGNNS